MRSRQTFVAIAAVLLTAWLASSPGSLGAESAREILDGAGVGGGLVVHFGSGDGKLTAALSAEGGYLVHGLDAEWANVEAAREEIESRGLTGKVSADRWDGRGLPYVENLVNLLVSECPMPVPTDEVLRVLAPGGVAYVKEDGAWTKTVLIKKPWPDDVDEWSHFLHDASGNAVAGDGRVGPPRHMQWLAEPLWTRNHHKLASISSVVTAGGRIFAIVDEASAASMDVPGKWFLVARDAFSGVLLWKRPIPSWAWTLQGFRSGPVQLPRTLVADGSRVYVPLGMSAPVTALDAATGSVLGTYDETLGAEEIILHDGVLLVVTGAPLAEQAAIDPARRGESPFPNKKSVLAVRADTGEVLWKCSAPQTAGLVPLTLAADGPRVFFAAGKEVACLDRNTGGQIWRSSLAGQEPVAVEPKPGKNKKKSPKARGPGWSLATLVVSDGVVLLADGKHLSALSAEDGKPLWHCDCGEGFRSPVDVFVVVGLVWLGPDFSAGRHLHTGEIVKTNNTFGRLWTVGHHHRCYRNKATDRYIMTAKRGIEFLDLASDDHSRNNWVRGLCQYGIMPANGLIYAPPHACGCFMEAKLYGFWALAAKRDEERGVRGEGREARGEGRGVRDEKEGTRLERGPAYDPDTVHPSSFILQPSSDWPMHRHDPARSGSATTEVPLPLKKAWAANVGGRPSAPVVAGGTVLVAAIDAHRVLATDALDGKTRWTFTAGGRVDSPPSVYRGLALFGCADGWVYALRMADGKLAWRFRAAPEELKTVALDQIESLWPVHGSVLVQDGVAYLSAGRSSYLDGGIYLYGLDPMTGKVLCEGRVESSHPKLDAPPDDGPETAVTEIVQNATDYKTFTAPDRSDAFSMGGATSDILVGDGASVYLRHLRFDRNCVGQPRPGWHLFSTSRLLDGAENHRSHWVLGSGDFSRTPVAYSWIVYNPDRFGSRLSVPHGLMLALDRETVWGVQRGKAGQYRLFSGTNSPPATDEEALRDFRKTGTPPLEKAFEPEWTVELPMRPRAMLRAGELVLLGGMPATGEKTDLSVTYEGLGGGLLWAASARDGKKRAEFQLDAPPVWDGMAAARGRLYVSTT
ncbi:MAG: PQQ-binding-like beta-propeller repeat protein, partial [Planctomycetota bacterium]